MKRELYFGFIFLLLFSLNIKAQNFEKNNYAFRIYKTSEKIIIDGHLDELTWEKAMPVTDFYQHYPLDDIPAEARTEVKVCYDDQFLYIAVKCFEDSVEPIIQTLKRDDYGKFTVSDGFSFIIDPVNDDKNGYFFALNAAGSQIDGTVFQSGGQPQTDCNWDNMWFGETMHCSEGDFYEIAVPFRSLKYNQANIRWGINFTRNYMKKCHYYVWTRFPQNFDRSDLCFNGEVEFANGVPLNHDGKFDLFPALSGKGIKDLEKNSKPDFNGMGGIDTKVAIGSNMNLNLSVFPDFSTVQVDRQYIDFYRFEYHVPEQRIFFLENNDLFSDFGTNQNNLTPGFAYKIKPFYSRRIAIKDWEYFTMYYGARLSGNASDKLRIGLMNVQTAEYKNLSSNNFTVATFQQSLFQRSSLRGLLVNKQNSGNNEFEDRYNRNAGLEFDYITNDSKWSILTKFHRSFNPDQYSNSNFYSGGVVYNSNKLRMQHLFNGVDENYISDAGYVPRLYHRDDIRDTSIRIGYSQVMNNFFYQLPNLTNISFHSPYYNSVMYFQPGSGLNEAEQELGYYSQFNNKSFFFAGLLYTHLNLLFPFDVLKNEKPLPAGKYDYITYYASWGSDPKKRLNFSFYGDYGNFYNGEKLFLQVKSEYRVQPWGIFQLSYDYCKLNFPEEYGNAGYHLITGMTEIGFSRSVIWTTLAQYNTQNENINVNSLIQWRFRPLSDIYLVFKDDVNSNGFNQKKIQVIFKLIYWLKA